MARRRFKNALCLATIPDYAGGPVPWALECHRLAYHPGLHRVVFRDGGVREWATGDLESQLTKPPEAASAGAREQDTA